MARRLTTAEVLLGLREARLARAGTRKRRTEDLTRQQRLALAPRPPRMAALQYLRVLDTVIKRARTLTQEIIFPVLPELVREAPGVSSQADPLEAQVGVRRDACGCTPVPDWYHRLHLDAERTVKFRGPWRVRGPGGVYSERLEDLEVALSEMVKDPTLVRSLEQVAAGLDAHNRAELSRILSLNLRGDNTLREVIDQFLRENVRLIESVATSHLPRMETIIQQATAGQVRVEDLQAEIMGTFNVSESRAALIARDQTLKANAELTQVRQQKVGVTDYIWSTSKDERVRGRPGGKWAKSQSDHWVLDGTRQTWLSPPVTNPVRGERNHPGRDYQCRCIAFPVTDDLLAGL